MATVAPICALVLFSRLSGPLSFSGKGIRVAIFETASALTTTVFHGALQQLETRWRPGADHTHVDSGGTCSTAGGIKQYRVYVLFKSFLWELRASFLPATAVVENYVWQGEWKDYLNDGRIRQVANFVFLYLVTYFVGSGILASYGYGIGSRCLNSPRPWALWPVHWRNAPDALRSTLDGNHGMFLGVSSSS